jgi:hypothetical protein
VKFLKNSAGVKAMVTPAAIGTWTWVEQSPQKDLCRHLSQNPLIIDMLAQEILSTRKHIDYPLYSKVFSLFFSTSAPLHLCIKITEAMKSIGLFETTDITESQTLLLLYHSIAAHDLEKSLHYFNQMKKNFGYEELCVEAFDLAIQNQFLEFITEALAVLTLERRIHIIQKCLLWAAASRATPKVQFWISMGGDPHCFATMEPQLALELKTTSGIKYLFHLAVQTSNRELALMLINLKFNIKLLGDFNPLNHFIEKECWEVVKAYVETYQIVQTPEAPLTEENLSALITYSFNLYQLVSAEQTSVNILFALLNSGIGEQRKFKISGSDRTLLEYAASLGNGHAFLAMIKTFESQSESDITQQACGDRLAKFFCSLDKNLEDTVLNLLALAETRQAIFDILFILADNYHIPGLLDILVDRDYSADNLIKNVLSSRRFSEEFLLKLLGACRKYAFRESMTSIVPLLLQSIKRRLTLEETISVIKIARNGLPAAFHALLQKELPYKTTRENNLLDIAITHFQCGGSIILLLNNGFSVENCAAKLLGLAILLQDELLLGRAIQHGADLEKTLIEGIDPLALAIYLDKTYCAKLLIQAGRSPDHVHYRPYPDGSEDNTIKPIELAVKNRRYGVALSIIETSKEFTQQPLAYQPLVQHIYESEGYEEERKKILEVLFKDFPFVKKALDAGPISQFSNNVIEQIKLLNPLDLQQIESKGRSILEIPWLIGKIPNLGHRMLRCLSSFQSIFSLDRLDLRLGSKAPAVFQYLLGIDQFHYHTLQVDPLLDPICIPNWSDAVNAFGKFCGDYKAKVNTLLRHKPEDLPLGFQEDYPIEAKEAFRKNFNPSVLINEIARIFGQIDNPQIVKDLLRDFFANVPSLPTCLQLHKFAMRAAFTIYQKALRNLINKDERFQDEDMIYEPEHLFAGAGRIFLFTAERDEFIGTPKKCTAEIEEFYAVMRRSIFQLLRRFGECKDRNAQIYCIAELGMAGNRCGGRWLGCLHQQLNYLKGEKAQHVTFIDELYLALRDRRQFLLESLIGNVFQGDVHAHNQIYKLISAHLGLAGGDLFSQVNDEFAHVNVTENRLRSSFYAKYHPLYLVEVLRKFLDESYRVPAKRELLILWIKSNIPDEFQSTTYLPLIETVTKAVAEKKSRNEINALLKDIYWNPDEPNPLKAIHNQRFLDFMEEVVMDEKGKFKVPFLLYMLLSVKVLSKPTGQLPEVV